MPALQTDLSTDWLPCEDDIVRYEAEGYLIAPEILPKELLDAAGRAIHAFLASGRSRIASAARASDMRRRNGDPIDHVGYLYHELAEVRELLQATNIGAIAARLARSASIRLFHDRLLVKPPEGKSEAAIGWHVDRAYWFSCTSDAMLTAWIPFADVDETMGPLSVLPGSHRWEDAPLMATAHRTDMSGLWTEATQGRSATARPLPMRKGQLSFHHCRTIHGSLPNYGTSDRAALAVHLQPGDNRWRLVLLPNGRTLAHTNDILCRADADGHPDYADPAIFPTLWPRT